jgi:hypothetical protein
MVIEELTINVKLGRGSYMIEFSMDRQVNIEKAIEACRVLIKTLSDPYLQPLEREAGYLLAKALRIQVEILGLLDHADVQEFIRWQDSQPPRLNVRRFPQDFVDLFRDERTHLLPSDNQ